MRSGPIYRLRDSYLHPLVVLDRVFEHRLRHSIALILFMVVVVVSAIIGLIVFINSTGAEISVMRFVNDAILPRLVGIDMLFFSAWLLVYMLEAYFRSFYFKEKELSYADRPDLEDEDRLSFQVLKILTRVRNGDVTEAFLHSKQGGLIMTRCGLTTQDIRVYLSGRNKDLSMTYPPVPSERVFTLFDLVQYIYEQDQDFANYLFENGVNASHLSGAARWVVRGNEQKKEDEQWWSKKALDRKAGLGAEWSYGEAYVLDRYSVELSEYSGAKSYSFTSLKNEVQLNQLIDILARAREANAMLVGKQGGGKMSLLFAFTKAVRQGAVPKMLEKKRVMMLDTDKLVSNATDKTSLEKLIIRVLNDAIKAGNIILAFQNFPSFLVSARNMGSDITSILDPYFDSDHIQIIGLAENDGFHQYVETSGELMRRFEVMMVEEPTEDESIIILQKVAERLESQTHVKFTYRSIEQTVNGVRNYFSDPIMPDKGIDVLVELPARVKREGRSFVKKEDVDKLIEEKTNVPIGDMSDVERDKLVHLERLLHERVIGQDEAVSVISNAMRRSRAGVRSMKRPIGSFLFIGPTGVGKTETTKALADVFFGSEANLARLDMSEFNGPDALDRLIGSFETGQIGVLVKIIRERPYGVLLLDEFEKAAPQVHDLFLQILDEGVFSDMNGKHVNCRNLLFIATSNAGAQMIFEYMQRGVDLQSATREIIDHIVNEGIFRPEFLNRFDAVVLFHPLILEHIERIAAIMLEGLKKRLKQKGFDLQVTPDLVRYVAERGVDPVFGARPMNRYIQENVEQVVADKMIRGEIREGSHFTLSPQDLNDSGVPPVSDTPQTSVAQSQTPISPPVVTSQPQSVAVPPQTPPSNPPTTV